MSFEFQRIVPVTAHAGVLLEIMGLSSGIIGHRVPKQLRVESYARASAFLAELPFCVVGRLAQRLEIGKTLVFVSHYP